MEKAVEVILGRNVTVNLLTIPCEVVRKIRSKLTFPNPVYLKNKKLGYWTGNIPKDLKLWKNHGRWLVLPRGFTLSLYRELKIFDLPFRITDYRVHKEKVNFSSKIKLFDYQLPAVEKAIDFSQGIIEAPCGSGKTIVGLEIIARAGQPSLWLVHTMELAQQAIERIEEFLNIPKKEIGFIGQGRWEIGNKITVGMIQTLVKKKLSSDFIKRFGLIILDEAHHTPATSFSRIVRQFPAYYRFGLTATPYRADGLSMLMYYHIGYTIYKITEGHLSRVGKFVKPVFKRIDTDFYYDYQDDFTKMVSVLVKDKKRNNLIIKIILEEVKKNNYCLIISDRVEHCNVMYNLLKVNYPEAKCAVLTGNLSKSKRDEIVSLVNSEKLNAIFATSKLAEEGLDWKILNRLFITCPSRSKRKIQQAVGRIQRPCRGKIDAVVYDFVDFKVGVLESQYKSRYFGVYEPMTLMNYDELS